MIKVKQKYLMHFKYVVLFGALLFVSGCATAKKPVPSGFLGSYENMVESARYKGLYVDHHQELSLKDYSSFMIEPITVHFHPDAKGVAVTSDALNQISDHVSSQLKEALSTNYSVVDEAGEGVAVIRVAITDVVANKVYLNLHWSTTLSGLGLGGASMEAEILDSTSNERIMAVIDSRKGKRTHYTKGLSKWGHTKDTLNIWIKMLTSYLDELHGK